MKQKRLSKCMIGLMSLWLAGSMVTPTALAETVDTTAPASELAQQYQGESTFPQVAFQEVEGELPSDRIEVDETTLYSTDYINFPEIYDAVINQNQLLNDLLPKDNFREMATYTTLYYYYESGDIEPLPPILISTDLLDLFTHRDLLDALHYDLIFKNRSGYMNFVTDDIYEAYANRPTFTPELMADVKANMMRAEEIYEDAGASGQGALDEVMADIQLEYDIFVNHYNNAMDDNVGIQYLIADNVEDRANAEESSALIEETLSNLPEDVLRRIGSVSVIHPNDLPASWDYSPIDAFATTQLDLYFAEGDQLSKGLIYHELGHIIDFSSMVYEDSLLEEYQSFAYSPEWDVIFQEEWNEEGSYYSIPEEAFAQSFASYALEYYHDENIEDEGYVGFGLDGRDKTREYFEQLFADLGL